MMLTAETNVGENKVVHVFASQNLHRELFQLICEQTGRFLSTCVNNASEKGLAHVDKVTDCTSLIE